MSDAIIRQGHVLDLLRATPAGSVHCVVTSPPYLGLRVYGTKPQVWGASGCEHVWGAEEPPRRSRWGDLETLSDKQASNRGSAANVAALEVSTGAFCRRCNAWRGELGSEPTVGLYIEHLVEVFREVRRVLRPDGICWVNIGDSYSSSPAGNKGAIQDDDGAYARRHAANRAATGVDAQRRPINWRADCIKAKDLCLIPQRLAIALQEDGWYVRADCIWWKPNPLPESVSDRPMTKDHEYVWMLTRSERYYWDDFAVREEAGGDGRRDGVGPVGKVPVVGRENSRGRAYDPIREASYDNGRNGHCGGVSHTGQGSSTRKIGADPSTRRLRSVWRINPQGFPGAHFATFPERLVETPILASTSAHGVCALCGAQWERIVELGEPDAEHQAACGADLHGEYSGTATKDFEAHGAQDASAVKARILAGMRERRTAGWRASCDCHPMMAGEPLPATVLDPFSGSGTTGLVALKHGRSYLGFELNPEYARMSECRIGALNLAAPGGG